MVLLLLSLTMFLVVLDSAIVNVALPAIKSHLNFDQASLQWVLTAYILTFGGFLMLGGRAADLFGRRKVLLWGIGGFTLFSLLIGLSHTSLMLIILRALQGLAAAFMAPTALSILLTTFAEGPERNKALSIWGLVASGGAAAGVFLGGVLTQYLGWQWCFFVNVPVGLLAIYGILKYIPVQEKDTATKNLDIPGAILVTAGLIAIVYALTLAPEAGWTAASTLTSMILGIILLALFIVNETKAKHPLVPLGIFKNRNLSGGNLIMLPVVAGALGQGFFLTLYIQNILHYSPVQTGLSFLPVPIIIGIISFNAPKFLDRFGVKPLLVTGTILVTLGVFLFSFLNENSSYMLHLLPAYIIMAIGFGLSFISVTIAATAGVPHNQAGLASGLLNTSQQVGGALGLAVLTVIANTATESARASGLSQGLSSLYGYQQVFLWASVMMLVSVFIAWFVIQVPKEK